MTHEPEKNVFSGARSQFEEIRKAIDELEYAGATLPAVHEQALAVARAALHSLGMSVGKIVDWGIKGKKDYWSFVKTNSEGLEPNEIEADLIAAESFFEGTIRDILKQEQAEAEARYYKDRRIDAACDADNAKDEEFCGPDGEGESE